MEGGAKEDVGRTSKYRELEAKSFESYLVTHILVLVGRTGGTRVGTESNRGRHCE